ncbi:MAG: GNAT family N-acetyltransferase [Verrucomicrobiota bacterium]
MGTGDVIYRRARLTDAAALLPLMRAFSRAEGIPFREPAIHAGLARLLRARRLGVVMVAEQSQSATLVGYAIGTFGYDLEFAGRDAFLTELFVQSRHRRGGVGRGVLDATLRALAAGGARAVTLLVLAGNRAARRLYSTAGFRPVPRVPMVRVF